MTPENTKTPSKASFATLDANLPSTIPLPS